MIERPSKLRFLALAALGAALACASCAARDERPAAKEPRKERPVAAEESKTEAGGDLAGQKRADQSTSSSTTALPGSVEAPPAPAPTQAPATAPGDSGDRRARALRAARVEVDGAQRELDASMSDCATACRALGSMERATGHLCDLASEHDDRRRCEDAKTAVLRAREKIRAACGSCPNGPSLDKTAPIPSRP